MNSVRVQGPWPRPPGVECTALGVCFRGRRLKGLGEDRGQEDQLQNKEGKMPGYPLSSPVPSLYSPVYLAPFSGLSTSLFPDLSHYRPQFICPSIPLSIQLLVSLSMFTCLPFPISQTLHSAACLSPNCVSVCSVTRLCMFRSSYACLSLCCHCIHVMSLFMRDAP